MFLRLKSHNVRFGKLRIFKLIFSSVMQLNSEPEKWVFVNLENSDVHYARWRIFLRTNTSESVRVCVCACERARESESSRSKFQKARLRSLALSRSCDPDMIVETQKLPCRWRFKGVCVWEAGWAAQIGDGGGRAGVLAAKSRVALAWQELYHSDSKATLNTNNNNNSDSRQTKTFFKFFSERRLLSFFLLEQSLLCLQKRLPAADQQKYLFVSCMTKQPKNKAKIWIQQRKANFG